LRSRLADSIHPDVQCEASVHDSITSSNTAVNVKASIARLLTGLSRMRSAKRDAGGGGSLEQIVVRHTLSPSGRTLTLLFRAASSTSTHFSDKFSCTSISPTSFQHDRQTSRPHARPWYNNPYECIRLGEVPTVFESSCHPTMLALYVR
jgi:hypothetical protein